MKDPDSLESLLDKANAALDLDKPSIGLEFAQQALGQDSRNETALELRSRALLDLQRFAEAQNCIEESLTHYPNCHYFLYQHAFCLLNLHQFRPALKSVENAIEQDPKIVYCWSLKGDIHIKLGEPENAIASAHKGLELDPENVQCLHILAMAYAMQGHGVHANAYYNSILALDPEHVHAIINRAESVLAMGQVDEATRLYFDCLRLEPENDEARQGLLSTLALRKTWVQSLFVSLLERRGEYQDLAILGMQIGIPLAVLLFFWGAPAGLTVAFLVLPLSFFLLSSVTQLLTLAAVRLSPQTSIYMKPGEKARASANLLTVLFIFSAAGLWLWHGFSLFWLLAFFGGILSLLLQKATRSDWPPVYYLAWVVLGATHAIAGYALHAELSYAAGGEILEESFSAYLMAWACGIACGATYLAGHYFHFLCQFPRFMPHTSPRRFMWLNGTLLLLGALPALFWCLQEYDKSAKTALQQQIEAQVDSARDLIKKQREAEQQSHLPQRIDLKGDSVGFRLARPFGSERDDTLLLFVDPSDHTLHIKWNRKPDIVHSLGWTPSSLLYPVLCYPDGYPDSLHLMFNLHVQNTQTHLDIAMEAFGRNATPADSAFIESSPSNIFTPLGQGKDFYLAGKSIHESMIVSTTLEKYMPVYAYRLQKN